MKAARKTPKRASGGAFSRRERLVATLCILAAKMSQMPSRDFAFSDTATPAKASPSGRGIALDDADWRWATWRKFPMASAPKQSSEFSLEDCCARLLKARTSSRSLCWNFEGAQLSPSMSRDEARFWLESMLISRMDSRKLTPKQKADELSRKKLKPASLLDVKKAIKANAGDYPPEIGHVLLALFPAIEIVELLLDGRPRTAGFDGGGTFLDGIRDLVMPRLTDADRAKLLKRIAPAIKPKNFSADYYDEPSGEFILAAMLGLHDELLAVVESWADDRYNATSWDHTAYHVPQVIVFGLGSAALVDKHVRRMKLALNKPQYMRAWLAHTEYAGLDYAAKIVVETKNKELAAKLAEVVAKVHAPDNAGPMLEIATRSKAPAIGVRWFEENVEHAVAGLVDVAAGRGALAEAAASRLSDLKRAGHGTVVDRAAKGRASGQKLATLEAKEQKLAPLTTKPKWLTGGLAKAKGLKAVGWLDVALLPKLELDGKRLEDEDTKLVVSALAASPLEAPHELVSALRQHAAPASRDAFARKIFEKWLGAGAVSKDKWALGALGHFGGDAAALELAKLVRAWPGESQHQRAVFGLDVLGAIGSDVALVQLSSIAQKVKFQALKQRANEAMDGIAKARKMRRDALEDRIVPDGGFGADGKRTLSFGARSFQVVLGAEGAPMVKEAGGKARPDLPKPGKQDDAALAARATEEWKTLKKSLRDTVKIQGERLEQAMVKGRSWSPADFDALLVRHPLMSHLVRSLVWGAWKGAKLEKTFRIAEDGTAADVKDTAFAIPKSATIRIVHPLDLDAATRTAWGTVMSDYEIIAPFPQLGRPVHALEPNETKGDDLGPRFAKKEWGVAAFIGKLRRSGWVHGEPQDAGYVGYHHKPFFSANVTAIVEHNGYPIGGLEYADPQKIERVFFVLGVDDEGRSKPKRLKLGAVDPKAVSEVLYDLG